jgi:nucleoid DNA-binding protein
MNRAELIQKVCDAYDAAGYHRPLDPHSMADFAVRTAFSEIMKALRDGDRVTIHDFGRWELRRTKGRRGYLPNTGHVSFPARAVIKFTAARSNPLERIRNDPFVPPAEFGSTKQLLEWLATVASSIDDWDAFIRAKTAWKATLAARSKLLSLAQQQAAETLIATELARFVERWKERLHSDPDYSNWVRGKAK